MQIAIIGGGVGGLAVAYNLYKLWPTGPDAPPRPSITVYEADDRFGGNGDTATFDLGTNVDAVPPSQYIRWADLGVNDFNKTAYVKIVDVMKEIGYTDYASLEDSTSYYTLDGSTVYASGNSPYVASMNAMPDSLISSVNAFMSRAAKDALNPAFANYTVKQYIDTVFSNHAVYDPNLGPMVIYPRINGMYFTDEVAPTEMPLLAVMHYYQIQEGAGGSQPAERMYFVNGASNWINALTDYMSSTMNIALVDKFKALLRYADGTWSLYNARGTTPNVASATPDVVVVATHADDALKLIHSGASTEVMNCLGRVKYLDSISVAHTYTGMLPPDYNAWCTYNILIRPDASYLKPYSITYVCNRHQNDGANPAYAKFGWPQFFITCNPPVPIPSQYILMDITTGKQAIANLRHNVFDFDCMSAQVDIQTLQGQDNLYFAGGWTVGAGLHEECWAQGEAIAHQIITGKPSNDHLYDPSAGPETFAPDYLRRLSAP